MNLLYTLTTYPPSTGGAQLHQHMLAQQMLNDHQVQVTTLWNTNRSDWLLGTTLRMPRHTREYTVDGVKVCKLGVPFLDKLKIAPLLPLYYPFMPYALPRLSQLYKKYLRPIAANADVIHNVRIGREPLSYASYSVARERSIPFVLTPVHHPRWVGWRYNAYLKLYRLADAVLALTKSEKQTLVSLGVNEDRIHVIGNGPHLAETDHPEAFIEKYRIDGPVVLFIGQHYEYKGYKQLLEAAPLVWNKVPAANFIFIGPSVMNSEQVFKALGDPRIKRLGTVSLQEKTDALAACTVFCMPSTQESFGGVYTEAWSFQKPVIGCNIPAVSEVISDGVDGLLINQNPREIAESIIALLLNPSLSQQMGQAGYNKVAAYYTWTTIKNRVENIYLRLKSDRQ